MNMLERNCVICQDSLKLPEEIHGFCCELCFTSKYKSHWLFLDPSHLWKEHALKDVKYPRHPSFRCRSLGDLRLKYQFSLRNNMHDLRIIISHSLSNLHLLQLGARFNLVLNTAELPPKECGSRRMSFQPTYRIHSGRPQCIHYLHQPTRWPPLSSWKGNWVHGVRYGSNVLPRGKSSYSS